MKVQPAMTFWSGHFFRPGEQYVLMIFGHWTVPDPKKLIIKKIVPYCHCAYSYVAWCIYVSTDLCVSDWDESPASVDIHFYAFFFSDPVNRWTVLHFQVTAFYFQLIKVSKFSIWPNGILIFLTWDFIGHINLNNWHQSCRLRQYEIWRCKYKSKKIWGTHLHPSSPLVFWASQL